VYFVVRPLELSLSAGELMNTSYNLRATPLQAVTELRSQEIALFVHARMVGPFDDTMTRAMLALVVFFALLLVGYRLPVSARLATRLSQLGTSMHGLDLRWVIVVWLTVGAFGELLVLTQVGGPAGAVSRLATQGNFSGDFITLIILNFYTAGLMLWICWHPPESRGGRALLVCAVCELALFYSLLGSRTLVLVPLLLVVLAWHERVKPFRLRVLVSVGIATVLFSSAYLTLRQDSGSRPLKDAIVDLPRHAFDARAILGASPVYDQVFAEMNLIPKAEGYRYGGEFAQGILGQVPSVIYPDKPEANDITFRKLVWGERFLAGRPIGAAGEFYRDFGFVGIVFGSLLFGVIARALTGLRANVGAPAGRELRIAIYVLGVLLAYQFTVGSYSLVFGSGLAVAVPLFLALRIFARPA
ncbi:MAG: O-antigen polysaccharide polymerase Wzy, partial [Solirubrobacteraceae bacterium]|nr:O-antigen polysaccharide polymerase Wzy [Solirubrobacteraceae bacterium]